MKRPLSESFRDAFAGIAYVLRTERNMRLHLTASVLVLALAWRLGIGADQVLLVLLAITFVLVAEMLNTAVEKSIDLFSPEYHPLAATAKNVAAGAVLTAAINAILVGVYLFGPRLLFFLRQILDKFH